MNIYNGHNVFFARSTTPDCNIGIHIHNLCEIFMALSDNVLYYIEGASYPLKKGDIIITNQKEIHRPTVSDDKPYSRQFVQFDPNTLSGFLSSEYNPVNLFFSRELGSHNKFVFTGDDKILIDQIFSSLEKAYKNKTPKNDLLFNIKLLELIILLDKEYYSDNKAVSISHTDNKMEKILSDIDNTFTHPFSLDEFSKKHYIDKYYLCHLFKKNTGFTLLEYIQSKRIQKAKVLILSGTPITDVSTLCGFNDYSVFYKAFKTIIGQSPREFKNSQT